MQKCSLRVKTTDNVVLRAVFLLCHSNIPSLAGDYVSSKPQTTYHLLRVSRQRLTASLSTLPHLFTRRRPSLALSRPKSPPQGKRDTPNAHNRKTPKRPMVALPPNNQAASPRLERKRRPTMPQKPQPGPVTESHTTQHSASATHTRTQGDGGHDTRLSTRVLDRAHNAELADWLVCSQEKAVSLKLRTDLG